MGVQRAVTCICVDKMTRFDPSFVFLTDSALNPQHNSLLLNKDTYRLDREVFIQDTHCGLVTLCNCHEIVSNCYCSARRVSYTAGITSCLPTLYLKVRTASLEDLTGAAATK